jgi:sugar (glycoside-pentoside-hexuronide) transporter
MGISAMQVACLLLVTRLLDAFAGLLMGFIIDRTQSCLGRSRPYFLWGALPFTLFSMLTFYTPPFTNQGRFLFAFLSYTGLSLSYTMVNMPLTSILPNLTKDPHERVVLATSRLIFAFCGAAIAGGMTLPLTAILGQGVPSVGILRTMIIFSTAAGGMLLVTFFSVEEKYADSVRLTLKEAAVTLAANTPWKIFAVNILFMWGAYFLHQAGLVFFYSYYVHRSDIIGTVVGITALAPVIGTFGTPFLINKMRKRNLFLLSSAIYLLGIIIMIIAGRHITSLLAGTVVAAIGFGLRHGVYFTMQADLADYSERTTGNGLTGLIAASNQFVGKVAMTVAGVLAGILLSAGQYMPGLEQQPITLLVIRANYLFIPAALVVISMVIMRFYRYD